MKRVLVVDDEDLICIGIEKALQRNGIDVKIAKNITEANKTLESDDFDLCLLDIKLPDGNGLNLIERIKNISPNAKIVIMSGNLLIDDPDNKISRYIFMPKPFDLSQIRTIVNNLLSSERSSI
jgi:two-component system response regulator PilR (NtrC family)